MKTIGRTRDFSLMRDAQSGNQIAFEQLVNIHDRAVLRLAFRITGSKNDIQDIYQEAFLKIYRMLGSFRFECSVSTWIYRIVTNVCFDHLRKSGRRKEKGAIEMSAEGEEYNLLDQVPDHRLAHQPEYQLFRREDWVHVIHAMRRLTVRERAVFELRYLRELNLRTVGERLNISEASVKTTLSRATQKLKSQLADDSRDRKPRFSGLGTGDGKSSALGRQQDQAPRRPPAEMHRRSFSTYPVFPIQKGRAETARVGVGTPAA
jgi:RNA polymerase sigma-70 factor (ECF subfamily)